MCYAEHYRLLLVSVASLRFQNSDLSLPSTHAIFRGEYCRLDCLELVLAVVWALLARKGQLGCHRL
jgi:hypothetical protein